MMTRRARQFMVAAAGLGAVGVLAAVLVHREGSHSANDTTPPPLDTHAANVQRLVVGPDGNPFGHTGGIQLPGRRSVAFNVVTNDFIKPVPGPHQAELSLAPDDLHSDWHLVKAGDVITEYGVRVKVLKIWRMPNPIGQWGRRPRQRTRCRRLPGPASVARWTDGARVAGGERDVEPPHRGIPHVMGIRYSSLPEWGILPSGTHSPEAFRPHRKLCTLGPLAM
jgi:hypothetical protein